ncbi:MAG: serine/threonine protein kinase, partial [Acidobacteriaceae bacterium]|nr:serine/threonine protein kinase [Acidobacteriaceae bacterium]
MNPQLHADVEKAFSALLDLSEAEQEAFIAREYASDPVLRAEIESLLRACRAAGTFLEPASPIAGSAPFAAPPPPTTVGRYRVIRLIGEGGMGSVYEAEQEQPRRTVALKVIRAGLPTPELLWRFEQESQALGRLQHPAIAQIYEAGTADSGYGAQPYFAMEFIHGESLLEYAKAHQFDLGQRLELISKVCDAVHHAHQRGIIHRDLKPGNILVDETGQPKVLDFGIACAADRDLRATRQTGVGQFIGTLAYMSPEQVLADPLELDIRSDVYALGVILYELLAGRMPYTVNQQLPQAVQTICEEVPRPLSSINRSYRGDVETIVAKALEKDKNRRYGSAADLAADIRRYLDNRPIIARPSTAWYRARKFARRYRVPLTALALIVGSLVAGLYVANRERAIAQRRFSDVRQLATKLFDIDVQVRELHGSTKARQFIVDTALEYLRRLSAEAQGDPDLALEVGNAYMRVARVQGVPTGPSLGQMNQAEENLRIAESFIQSVLKAQPANRTAMLRSAQVAHDRMILARFSGRDPEALALARKSAYWLDRFQAGKGDETEASGILNAYLNVAQQFKSEQQFEEALRLCSRASNIARTFNRPAHVGTYLWISAEVFQQRGELEKALDAIQQSVKLLDPGPQWTTKRAQTSNFQSALVSEGSILGDIDEINLGKSEEAVKVLDHAFRIADELVHTDTNDHTGRGDLSMAAISLGRVLSQSDATRASEIYDHALG